MSTSFQLNNGKSIPAVGLGTWNADKPGEVKAAVLAAIDAGYKHIDCAHIYGNEQEIGEAFTEAVASGKIAREELFVTSKLWNDSHGKEDVENACVKTLANLQLNYLDLYLIHWPCTNIVAEVLTPSIQETWLAMEALVAKGLVRSIGVSNFTVKKLNAMKEYATIFPAVNQVELHPLWRQDALLAECKEMGVHLTAYSPLGSPGSEVMVGHKGGNVMSHPVIIGIASEVDKSAAQVCIRWAVQRGTSVVPKSSTPGRIAANFAVHDWELSEDQMTRIGGIEEQMRLLAGTIWLNEGGPYRTTAQLWDEDA